MSGQGREGSGSGLETALMTQGIQAEAAEQSEDKNTIILYNQDGSWLSS